MMMRQLFCISIGAVLCATQVSALSCMRPDVARTFQQVAAAEESYVVLLGQFSFDAPERRRTDVNNPMPLSVPARFEGSYLGAAGFEAGPDLDLTMVFSCAGPWCGSMTSGGDDVLAFVQQTPAGYTLEVGPCQSNLFAPQDAPRVEACMRGEGCEEEPLR